VRQRFAAYADDAFDPPFAGATGNDRDRYGHRGLRLASLQDRLQRARPRIEPDLLAAGLPWRGCRFCSRFSSRPCRRRHGQLGFGAVNYLSEGDIVLEEFQFHGRETFPELRIHFLTLMSGGCTSGRRAHQ
jgi:hypothetical protein